MSQKSTPNIEWKLCDECTDPMDCGSLQSCHNKSSVNYITNRTHGGKVTCHKCNDFILTGKGVLYPRGGFRDTDTWFHVKCFDRYEHYYGLDKPIY